MLLGNSVAVHFFRCRRLRMRSTNSYEQKGMADSALYHRQLFDEVCKNGKLEAYSSIADDVFNNKVETCTKMLFVKLSFHIFTKIFIFFGPQKMVQVLFR